MRLTHLLLALMIVFPIENNWAQDTAWHFKPSDVNALHSEPADYRLAYGNDPLQFGDLRLPKNVKPPYPVAIIIHGGCWMTKFADLQNTAALADALRDEGIATWNIEYRRADSTGGGWPGTFLDIGNGVDYLRAIAKKYTLDLNKVIVIGQSAGGHFALWVAGRHHISPENELYSPHPLNINGVIAMGGVPDLKAYRQQGMTMCETDAIGKLLGNNEASIEQHYQSASPINLLPLGVPQILIYGEDDTVVPITYGTGYVQAAKRQGERIKLVGVKYAAHHEYNVPNSVVWPEIQSALHSLLGNN